MQEATKVLNENRVGSLATVNEGKPQVRPFEFQFEEKGKFYFCTANTKDIYKQLKAQPAIQFATTSKDYVTVRISGEIKFSNDLQIKERIISNNDLVRSIYRTADNPTFEIFYLEHGEAVVSDFSGQPPRKYSF